MDLQIKKVNTKKTLEQVFNIRKKVFIDEQKVPVEIEMDKFDRTSDHFIAYLNKKPVGCARIRYNDFAKLERIAILKEHRNKGYGTQLTKYLIQYCKNKKIKKIVIHSQMYVLGFYKKFGFKTVGEPFDEAGIKHVKMILELF